MVVWLGVSKPYKCRGSGGAVRGWVPVAGTPPSLLVNNTPSYWLYLEKTVFLAGDSLGTTAERYNSDDGDIVEAHGGQARLEIKVNWLS